MSGDASGGNGDDGYCGGILMMMNCRRGGRERKYMSVIEVDKIEQSHAEFLVGDGFMLWMDLELFVG